MGNFFIVFVALVFVAAILLFQGLYALWNTYRGPEAQRIQDRLRHLAAGGGESSGSRLVKERLRSELPLVDRLLLALPRSHELDALISQSGVEITPTRFALVSAVFGLATFVVGILVGLPILFAAAIGAGGSCIPFAHVLRKRGQRMRKVEEVLPDTLDFIARALRAGHAFSAALGMVGEEGQEPLRSEFRTTFDEINFGVATQEALNNLSRRIPSSDLRFFVVAVLIQRETGGNLAEILGNISKLVRDRLKLYGRIRVLSAEGKLSAWILTILPFATAALINVVNPSFMSVLWKDPVGLKIVAGTCVMMVVGIFWMWRIIKIRV
jgi:tight adherence protein B